MKRMCDQVKRVTSVFTPSVPITDPASFIGREKQKEILTRALIAPGRHIAIYGERGVGKTSLLNIATIDATQRHELELASHTCSSRDTFSDIVASFLDQTGQRHQEHDTHRSRARTFKAQVKIPVAGGGAETTQKTDSAIVPVLPGSPTLYSLARNHFLRPSVFVIDEFDRITTDETRRAIADFMKILSDLNAPCSLAIAGVANTAANMVGQHPSTVRCLTTIHVPRMSDDEIRGIATRGGDTVQVRFSCHLLKLLVRVCCGMPYFAHLLCEELCLLANEADRTSLGKADFFRVLDTALANVSEDLHASFAAAIRPAQLVALSELQGLVPTTPAGARKLAVLALAIGEDLKNTARLFNRIASLAKVFLIREYEEVDDTQMAVILDEVERLSDIVYEEGGIYRFRDAMHRGFAWLCAAQEMGDKAFSQVVADQN